MQHDWMKPAAKAIPKEGFFEEEQGRYEADLPQEDSRVLWLHDHREDQARHGADPSAIWKED